MYPMDDFINRNKNTYLKISNVPIKVIDKYTGIVPDELIYIWKNMGFGIYEDGFLQIINPEEYDFMFNYIDKILEPSLIWGLTALGDLLGWEGKENSKISTKEGDRCYRINIREFDRNIIDNMEGILNIFINNFDEDKFFISDSDYFGSQPYLEIKDKLPKLEYGQCYGYVPALPLGGKALNENLQVVDAKSYINIIGEAVGKIYSKD